LIALHQGVFTAADEDEAGTAGASIGQRVAEPRPRTGSVSVSEGKRAVEKSGIVAGDITALVHHHEPVIDRRADRPFV
jgi:hypothetical protein